MKVVVKLADGTKQTFEAESMRVWVSDRDSYVIKQREINSTSGIVVKAKELKSKDVNTAAEALGWEHIDNTTLVGKKIFLY